MESGSSGGLNRTPLRRLVFPALAISLSVVVTLSGAEIALRLSGARSAVLHSEMFQIEGDPLLPYTLLPGYEGSYAGGQVTVGTSGNRVVPSHSPDGGSIASAGAIVVLGDSVAFGQGLDDGDTIAANLGRLITNKEPVHSGTGRNTMRDRRGHGVWTSGTNVRRGEGGS
ncbi:MAG: hypothetical protein ABL971_10420, partial [Vicinamibacterales bacterium]